MPQMSIRQYNTRQDGKRKSPKHSQPERQVKKRNENDEKRIICLSRGCSPFSWRSTPFFS